MADIVLSSVPPNTVEAPQLVLSRAVPQIIDSRLITDFFYRYESDNNADFIFLGSAPVGETLKVPIELKGLPIIVSTVTRAEGSPVTTDPRKGEFHTFTPNPEGSLDNDLVKIADGNLDAWDLINIYDDGGVAKARKAHSSNGRHAHAFTATAVNDGEPVYCIFAGVVTASGLTAGPVYLGTTGGITQTVPNTDGHLIQEVGIAQEADSFYFKPHPTGFIL